MQFTQERVEEGGVMRRLFELTVAGETVPGVIWAPQGAVGPRPLVMLGHGGSQHKKVANIAGLAKILVTKFGYAVLAIDETCRSGRSGQNGRSWRTPGR